MTEPKAVNLIKKMTLQLQNCKTHKEIKKINLEYNRHIKNVLVSDSFYKIIDKVNDEVIKAGESEFNEWVYSSLLSELNKIAREGKASIRFKLSFEEFEYLKGYLKLQIRV